MKLKAERKTRKAKRDSKLDKRIVLDPKEQRRRRRERIIIVFTIVLIVVLSYVETHLSSLGQLIPISNNVLVFGLININIILIILLIFLIIRNIVKLVYERRHKILGSKLRTKLVTAFVSLSLVPTIILFLVALNLLSYSIDNWFNMKVGGALNYSLEIAQSYYQQSSENAKFFSKQLSTIITNNKLYESQRRGYLETLIQQRQKDEKLGMIEIHLDNRNQKISIKGPDFPDIVPKDPTPETLEEVFSGKEATATQTFSQGDLVCGLSPIYSSIGPQEIVGFISVYYFIPRSLIDKMGVISQTSEEYKQFRLLKNPIKLSYILTLFIITLLIIFSATWFGIYLAKGITVPIQDLAEATRNIAQGNLDYHIDIASDDEIGVLVDAFNQMTTDLKISQNDVEQANFDLEQRRKYMETVLRNVSAGVVSIDKQGIITTINRAAEKMLGIKTEKVLNARFQDVLRPEHMEVVNELLQELEDSRSNFIEKKLQLNINDNVLTVWMTTSILKDDEGKYMGLVVVFEDLTAMQRAERMAAWREVARRIAHEIKNPLTPVQLSAQRLQRRYGERLGDDAAVFDECTKTIIDQVEVMKNLVNEFSRFARMPVTQLALNDLNEVISGTVSLFQDAHKDIAFVFERGEDIPMLNLDPEQIKRVMMNLLDNAVAALPKTGGKVEIRTSYDKANKLACVEVVDNGAGIPQKDKTRIFEPYYSTKKTGTGLGLAIVSSIIADHLGRVRLRDNVPQGTVITIELPA